MSTYYEYNMSFHCVRETIHSPWDLIGVFVTKGTNAVCQYVDEHKHLEAEFHNRVVRDKAGLAVGTKQYLEDWRALHQEPLNAMTPVFTYACLRPQTAIVPLCRMVFATIVDSANVNRFFVVGLMIRQGYWIAGCLKVPKKKFAERTRPHHDPLAVFKTAQAI